MFRSSPPSERIFDEIQRIERLSFDFGEEKQPSEFVETLCENMQVRDNIKLSPKTKISTSTTPVRWNPMYLLLHIVLSDGALSRRG